MFVDVDDDDDSERIEIETNRKSGILVETVSHTIKLEYNIIRKKSLDKLTHPRCFRTSDNLTREREVRESKNLHKMIYLYAISVKRVTSALLQSTTGVCVSLLLRGDKRRNKKSNYFHTQQSHHPKPKKNVNQQSFNRLYNCYIGQVAERTHAYRAVFGRHLHHTQFESKALLIIVGLDVRLLRTVFNFSQPVNASTAFNYQCRRKRSNRKWNVNIA